MTTSNGTRIAVAVVNYNTAEPLSHLLLSLFRIAGRDHLARVVVVDNNSTDASRPLLGKLAERGLVECIFNRQQQYHGPALNQAIDYLAARRRLGVTETDRFDVVWVLDSDTIVLREDTISHALHHLQETAAGLLGEFQYDALPEGYVHPCALFLDLEQTFVPRYGRFDESGAPARLLHLGLRKHGVPIAEFPILSQGYVLHIGRGARRAIHQRAERTNRHFSDADTDVQPHYHNNPLGPQVHQAYLRVLAEEVGELTPTQLAEACLKDEPLDLELPALASPEGVAL